MSGATGSAAPPPTGPRPARRWALGLVAACLPALSGCFAPTVPVLARAQLATDFATYDLRRMALLVPTGPRDTDQPRPDALRELQDDLLGYLSAGTPYEWVEIPTGELGELDPGAPWRDGRLSIDALVGFADRFGVDAVLYTHVSHERIHPPLAIGLNAELVSVDTGQLLWTASVRLDGADEPTRDALRAFYALEHGMPEGGDGWKVALVSPRRFARFAAWQLAQML